LAKAIILIGIEGFVVYVIGGWDDLREVSLLLPISDVGCSWFQYNVIISCSAMIRRQVHKCQCIRVNGVTTSINCVRLPLDGKLATNAACEYVIMMAA